MKILLISFAILFLGQCGGQKVTIEPCYKDRSVTSTVKKIELKCLRTGDQSILVNNADNSRYSVCNTDENPMIVGELYIITGIVYEMKPNERWSGTPLQITESVKK